MSEKDKSILENIEILPAGENALFTQREHEKQHTAYETEVMLYSAIQKGDSQALKAMISSASGQKLIMGRLSTDNLRQIKYWSICCITLATRYAIRGGLDENRAYCFSDDCIMDIDAMTGTDMILDYLYKKAFELTEAVSQVSFRKDYPEDIRRCINYISVNLHKNITLEKLAQECGLDKDYLSCKFKRVTGERPGAYIRRQKLLAARELLSPGFSCSQVAYQLGFCSESYFIKCFRQEYGITPKQYIISQYHK